MNDDHDTHRSPASQKTIDRTARRLRATDLLLVAGVSVWAAVAGSQAPPAPIVRHVELRVPAACGGSILDGVCLDGCSGSPLEPDFDADCFSCGEFHRPEPKPACQVAGEPCEIHAAITRLGAMMESRSYDDSVVLSVTLAYWDDRAWDLSTNWGASALDGYVAYSVVRAALAFADDIGQHPTTTKAIECMLRDHAERGIPTTPNNGERWLHGGVGAWNSWSEDYMGFALGYAAADAWFSSSLAESDYYGEYFERVSAAVGMAFSISDRAPWTLVLEQDPDPNAAGSPPAVMIRNHNEYSPVYGVVLLKHLADINNLYRAASLPPYFTEASKPATYDALYRWVVGKIEPNPEGAGFVFRSDGCQRRDGTLSYCDDRPGDPEGSCGVQREPGHYPLADSLPSLGVGEGLEYFSAPCGWVGPAGIVQAPHNYVFNCVFAGEKDRVAAPNPESM